MTVPPAEPESSSVVLVTPPMIVRDRSGNRYKVTEYTPGKGFMIVRPMSGGPEQVLASKDLRPVDA